MKVKTKALMADASGNYKVGSILNVSDEEAEALVNGGWASYVEAPQEVKADNSKLLPVAQAAEAPEAEVETADAPVAETAEAPEVAALRKSKSKNK